MTLFQCKVAPSAIYHIHGQKFCKWFTSTTSISTNFQFSNCLDFLSSVTIVMGSGSGWNPIYALFWLIILLLLAIWVASFCAFWYIFLSIFTPYLIEASKILRKIFTNYYVY
ncbi:hypothetical protein CHUAL_004000 [Chamberlinius hualienensis]